MKIISLILSLFICIGLTRVNADDFFDLKGIRFYQKPPSEGPAVFTEKQTLDPGTQKKVIVKTFVPCLQVRIGVKEQIKASSVFAHAYFFDQNKALVATSAAPADVDQGMNQKYAWPVILPKEKEQVVFFAVPDQVLQQQDWSAVVVFGDSKGVDAQLLSVSDSEMNRLDDYDYPEKGILENKDGPPIERKPAMDPLIEHVVETYNPQQPQITIFLRPPLGMSDATEAKGVLCMSLLADSLEGVKRQLQGFEGGQELRGILKFAQEHKLIIICWGSRGLWDPHKNWDDLSPDIAWNTDKAFDQVATAWEKGVKYYVDQYGIPSHGYLLWGMSGSAQYACRLALRKPDYFLAIHAHIPSSFDKPTLEGRKVLWCLTTGEEESGYKRSLHFYAQCRALGYPMIYKAIMHLGHQGSPIADNLGLKFFEYALNIRDQRFAYDDTLSDPLKQLQTAQADNMQSQPWLDSFRKPAYVGDAVNQGIVSYDQQERVPAGFWVPLPTKEIADAWNH